MFTDRLICIFFISDRSETVSINFNKSYETFFTCESEIYLAKTVA